MPSKQRQTPARGRGDGTPDYYDEDGYGHEDLTAPAPTGTVTGRTAASAIQGALCGGKTKRS